MWEATIQMELSEVVRGQPSELRVLLSSPAAWCLWPGPTFMFAVPGTQALRFFIGPTARGPRSALFEVDELSGSMVRLRTLPKGRQEFTLSVSPGRRGTAKASVRLEEVVPRMRKLDYETKRRSDLKSWLAAIRAVIERRAPWPNDKMSADLRRRCAAQPLIERTQHTSASALISADPATVWDVVHSPDAARILGPSPAAYSGYVPGTPDAQPGEMQYFVSQSNDRLAGEIAVASEIGQTAGQRSALYHNLGHLQVETKYLLTYESEAGPTRLDLAYRWPAPEKTEAADAARGRMVEYARIMADSYRALIETPDEEHEDPAL